MSKNETKPSNEARDIAKSNLDQAKQAYEAFSQAAERMVEATQKGLPETAKEFNGKLFSYANHNISEMFELAQKLVQADSMEEALRIQNAYFSKQTAQLQKQASEIAAAFQPKKEGK